ncbi:MAG: DUF2877 domain-containing protein [Elusimicrobia bacterium]|nr:DUF2877 domain-containing protein [Elusimicrobiota bacterium]
MRGLDFAAADSLDVRADSIVLGGERAAIGRRYDSRLRPGAVDRPGLAGRLRVFENAILEYASPKSLAFLLDPNRDARFGSAFEQGFVLRLRSGTTRLLAGDCGRGAAEIRGLGFGLTPSGDDFLAGFLLGLNAAQASFGTDLSEDIRAIYTAARTENPFSRAFLSCAAQGRYSEQAKRLVLALLEGAEDDIRPVAARLLAMGASSGADLGVGLLLSLRKHSVPSRQPAPARAGG